MTTELRRTVIALVVTLCIGVPVTSALSFDINDLLGDTDVTFTTTRQGLDGYYTQECKTNVGTVIQQLKSGYLKQILSDTVKSLVDTEIKYGLQLLKCYADNFFESPGAGSPGGRNCSKDVGGETASAIKRQYMDTLEKNFIARCTADSMRRQVGDDIRRITQENGPEGGAAYVTDWINDIYVDPDRRAINRFGAILVNTPICEDFRDAVYGYYDVPQSYIDNPPSLTGLGLRVDGGASFIQTAACTRPPGLTPEKLDEDFLGNGGFQAMELLREPQNNFVGFIQMADAELQHQREIAVAAAETRAIAGGGFTGTYAQCRKDPNGKCLADGIQQQPPGGLRDAIAAVVQGEVDWINNSKEMNTLIGDVHLRLVSMILDMQADALDYDVEVDASTREYTDIASGIRQPDSPSVPPGKDPSNPQYDVCGVNSDPSCTGGNAQCCCVRGAAELDGLRQRVADATRAAIQIHPELVSSDGSSVIPGNERLFLQAICETTALLGMNCHVHPGQNDEIVVGGGTTISVHVIASSGLIRLPGQTIAACEPGVQ